MKIMRPALDLPIAQLRALGLGVRGVRDDQQWRVEQRFDFFHRHAVLLALSQVAGVPVEACQGLAHAAMLHNCIYKHQPTARRVTIVRAKANRLRWVAMGREVARVL